MDTTLPANQIEFESDATRDEAGGAGPAPRSSVRDRLDSSSFNAHIECHEHDQGKAPEGVSALHQCATPSSLKCLCLVL